jgi:hypothetical protein
MAMLGLMDFCTIKVVSIALSKTGLLMLVQDYDRQVFGLIQDPMMAETNRI